MRGEKLGKQRPSELLLVSDAVEADGGYTSDSNAAEADVDCIPQKNALASS